MRGRTALVSLAAASVALVALAWFTPQGAVRRYLTGRGELLDALTVTVEKGRVVYSGGQQYYVSRYRTEDPARRGRMHLSFFYVRRLSWGPYVVVEAGTGP